MSERDQQSDGHDGAPQDAAAQRTREAQEAHGGSMAPGLVDETGHPVTDVPADRPSDAD
jgi:hypothetical protein